MIALVIFLITLLLLFIRPFKLPIWAYSTLGAALVFAFSLLNLDDVKFIFSLVWDSSLTLIALIILCFSLELLGFFEALAHGVLKLSSIPGSKLTPEQKAKTRLESGSGVVTEEKQSSDLLKEGYTPVSQQDELALFQSKHDTYYVSSRKLLLFMLIFVFFLSAFFANDGAILIITPIVIALFRLFEHPKKIQILAFFLLSLGFLCDAASNALIISNLTNIITANYFELGFTSFAKTMLVPNVFALLATIAMVFGLYFRRMPDLLEFRNERSSHISPKLFIFCCLFLGLFVFSLFAGEFLDLNVSVFALTFAAIFWIFAFSMKGKQSFKALKDAPWGVIVFSFGLYIVVFSLQKNGAGDYIQELYTSLSTNTMGQIFGTGFIAAFGSSIFNNLPMVLLGDLALHGLGDTINQAMVYAHLLGCNIGVKLTPIGSLATLLWLGVLAQRGIHISLKQFFKFGIPTTIGVLFCSLVGLMLVSS